MPSSRMHLSTGWPILMGETRKRWDGWHLLTHTFLYAGYPYRFINHRAKCMFKCRWRTSTKRGRPSNFCRYIAFSPWHVLAFNMTLERCALPRFPVSRSCHNPGRVKRVVSCKRKTHHLAVARRKQPGTGRPCDAANKENEMKCAQDVQQEIFDMDPWEFPLNVNNNHRTGRTGPEQADYCALTEVRHTVPAQTVFLVLLCY